MEIVEDEREDNSMSTKERHIKRSHRTNRKPMFKSKDKAHHDRDVYGNPIFKAHTKKYDGKGNRVDE